MRMSLSAYITCLFQELLISNSCYFEIITCTSWWYIKQYIKPQCHVTRSFSVIIVVSLTPNFLTELRLLLFFSFLFSLLKQMDFMSLWECHSPFMVSTTSYNLKTGTLLAAYGHKILMNLFNVSVRISEQR